MCQNGVRTVTRTRDAYREMRQRNTFSRLGNLLN